MRIGPESQRQFDKWRREWKQGQHVLISGPTGTGKTTYSSKLAEIRYDNNAYIIDMVTKIKPDATFAEEFKGWTRWKRWQRGGPSLHERRILLMPDLRGHKTTDSVLAHQKEVFEEALDASFHMGRLTVIIDEGLYMCSSTFLGLSKKLAMGYTQGRSNHLTYITNTQRPANLPLEVYGSASHAIIGQTRDADDLKRVRELGARESSKELGVIISGLGPFEFLHIPARSNGEPVVMDLKR